MAVDRDIPEISDTADIVAKLTNGKPSNRQEVAIPRVGGASDVRRYRRLLALTDSAAVALAVFTAYLVRFDLDGAAHVNGGFETSYLAISVGLLAVWMGVLSIRRTRDRRILGTGPTEYHRVWSATWRVFAVVAIVAYLLRMDIGRGYLAIAFPLGLALLLLGRFAWRQWLHRRRDSGFAQSRVLVVGNRSKAQYVIGLMHENANAGFGVVGVCVPVGEEDGPSEIDGVPVLGTMEQAARIAETIGASAVAVAGSDKVTTQTVRQLGWDLEGSGVDLAITMPLRDVAGPRVTMQPVNGLPLVYVDEASFSGPRYLLKSATDWVAALIITVVLSPTLVAIAILVKTTSKGPVLYRQERIGIRGSTFKMLKFRSMIPDAHLHLEEVLAAEGISEIEMFYKPKNDPRVTAVGRVLRKYSLDELPQLFNVLRGEMSLVGPRPQIAQEVARHNPAARRRLLVKPGLTGLWQVSGRSDLTENESVRLDLYYAENWSFFSDLLILARTIRVLLGGQGAY